MLLPRSTSGKFAVVFFAIFLVALNPPVVTAVGRSSLFFGFAPLYLWFVWWGLVGTLILVWAAHRDAFGLTEDQVPPELERAEETPPAPEGGPGDSGVD